MPSSTDAIDRPRSPIAEMLAIAIPTVLQMASYTVQQFTDVLMLSVVGDAHATAAAVSGLAAFCTISFGFGILTLVNTMVGQAFGGGRMAECGSHLWQGIWVAVAYGLLVMPLALAGDAIFGFVGHSDELRQLEIIYYEIVIAFVLVKMLATALGNFLIAAGRAQVVLASAVAGVVVNILANYVLIFGHLGFPAMGVAGAAWGTNLGVLYELLLLAVVAFGGPMRRRFSTLSWRPHARRLGELVRYGVPSGFQITADVVAWMLFMFVVMNEFGQAALAANNYMIQYMKISFMPALGLGTAVCVLVARYVGAGRPDLAADRAHLGFKVGAAYMVICGLGFVLFSESLMRVFTRDDEVIRMGRILLVFCAVYQLFDAMFIIYSNALRGVKDTFWPATVQIVLCWVLVVGGGWLVAIHGSQWGIGGPWAIATVYGIALGFYLLLRFKAGRWKTQPAAEVPARVEVTVAAAVAPIAE